MTELSLILAFVLFGIYGWLCSVEFGIGLLRLLPSSTLSKYGLRLLRPLWVITNIFLVLGFIAFAMLFNGGLTTIFNEIGPLVVFAVAIVLARLLLLLYLKFAKVRTGLRWQNLLLNAMTLTVPLSFGAAGIKLLIGHDFWQASPGWVMMITLLVGLLAIGLSFVYFVVGQTPHDRLHQVSRWMNILLSLFVVTVFQLSISHAETHLSMTSFTDLVTLTALAAFLQIGLWLSARERYMWWYLSLIGVLTPLLLGLANKPYLAYPRVTVAAAYSNEGTIIASSILPLVIIGTVLFVRSLLIQPKASKVVPKKRRTKPIFDQRLVK